MHVSRIESAQAMDMVMNHHYSQRKVGCRAAFGLFNGPELVGCCTYSVPASYTLCNGVCGKEYRSKVLELSRLVILTEAKNAASIIVGSSLRSLDDSVLVSYADSSFAGHVGYIYQATNWIYTGRGSAEPKWCHPVTGEVVSYTRRHIDKKALAIGLDWHELVKVPQTGKHRYVTFSGNRRFKKLARKSLNYETFPYPKGPTTRHHIEGKSGLLF